ncbi:MAG TPA: DUF1559 domain-containing protein [Capsulimonadaceae bacterium]|jgi:prepilin-type N-terminal cleavage/methylation domain-containing protein/prepilin-type processing-associated H-X9-DG protein
MRKSAFTLIELLVVIAIIAILAAILFPVFAKAREKARQTTCASNQKQLTLAMIQYSQDFDEVYPSRSYIVDPNISWVQQVYPYVKTWLAYQCPDDTVKRAAANYVPVSYTMADNLRGGKDYISDGFHKANSGMSGYVLENTPYSGRAQTASNVEAPATTLMIVEYYSQYNYNGTGNGGDTAYAPSYNFPCQIPNTGSNLWWQDGYTAGIAIHNDGWNYGFADGHVKWLRPEQTLGKTAACLGSTHPNNKGMWTIDPND